jgi:hypothetical protein
MAEEKGNNVWEKGDGRTAMVVSTMDQLWIRNISLLVALVELVSIGLSLNSTRTEQKNHFYFSRRNQDKETKKVSEYKAGLPDSN